MLSITITIEDPRGHDATDLLALSDAFTASLYPAESRHQADLASLTAPAVRFFVARSDGMAAGCGALVIGGDGTGELKRMFVSAAARGRGVGQALLRSIEAAAQAQAVRLLQLETGIHNAEALRLYRRFGYVERGPFGAYLADPLSVFMEKPLA